MWPSLKSTEPKPVEDTQFWRSRVPTAAEDTEDILAEDWRKEFLNYMMFI